MKEVKGVILKVGDLNERKSWDCSLPKRQLCDRLSGQLGDQQQQVGEDSQDLK